MAGDPFLGAAIAEAAQGRSTGGIPIGSVLVVDGEIVGCGHNQRVQKGSVVLHAEMDCLENAGRMRADVYQRATIYSTLSPCAMCTGAILLYGIPRLVVGENQTFQGPQHLLEDAGVEVTLVNDERCITMMLEFIAAEPGLWDEDIGEP
jgi:cytosine deaminase